jgi:DNA-binding IclR family transcriptional regulator
VPGSGFGIDGKEGQGMNASTTATARTSRKRPPPEPGQPDKFNAIQKVCAILRVLAQRSPLRLTDIADTTSLNKATALRILNSLIEEGFVSRVAGAKTYELGQEARVMAVGARRSVDIAELAQPSLLRLSERSADTALLSVRSGVEALYLARSVGNHPLQPNYLQIGSRRPLGVGAGALALLVWLPDAEIEAVIEVIVPRLAKSPRITPKFLRERIAMARKAGHTVLIDAAFPGMGGVGVPVRDDAGEVVAALSIGAASDRIRRREGELADMLKKEAQVLARALAQAPKNGRAAKMG